MTKVRRFAAVLGGLALTAVLSSPLWGDNPAGRKDRPLLPGDGTRPAAEQPADPETALARSKFSGGGVVTYRPAQGDAFFALQLQPKLAATPRRPRDYLVLVSTSAGQAGAAWTAARQIAGAVAKDARAEDRVSLWCVSTPEPAFTVNLTGGFVSPKAEAKKVETALAKLAKQYPAGDADLKSALTKALSTFDAQQDERQRVILYLGDGLSTHTPLSAADRTALCREMVERRVQFFSVPMGLRLDPHNLHGLATGSGGAVTRVQLLEEPLDEAMRKLEAAVAAPVLYPERLALPACVLAHYPTRLPPLRPDAPTLVVGRMKDAKELAVSITGKVISRRVTVTVTEKVHDPEADNFFLVSLAEQWKNAKDQHALIRADRALVAAFEQNRFDRLEALATAQAALQQNELREAGRWFQKAKELAPHDPEATAGLKVVTSLQSGKLTRLQIQEQLNKADRQVDRVQKGGVVRLTPKELVALAQQADEKLPKVGPLPGVNNGNEPENLLQAHRDRMLVEEQKLSQAVEANLRQARRELAIDPDGAYELLRSTLLRVRDHPDLSDRVRDDLLRRLQNQLRTAQLQGAEVKLRRAQDQAIQAQTQAKTGARLERQAEQERIDARFRTYRNLINVARFERFTQEKLLQGLRDMQTQATVEGKPWPLASQSAYLQVSASYNLQVQQELRRKREMGFLAVLLEVEKSHIPYPDEPPIHFPPLATWQAITKLRKERYEVTNLPDDPKGRMASQRVEKLLEETIDMKDFQAPMTLKEALGLIQDKLNAKYNVKDDDILPILIDAEAFKEENPDAPDIYDTQVKYPSFPRRMSIAIALRLALAKVPTNNATYLIRRNFIEVTTIERQTKERVLAVYPVGDLVIPISSRRNPFAMMGAGGGLGGGFGMMGGMGMMGMGGGMMGMMGMGGGMMGMMGGGMMGMGGMGMGGMGGMMGMGGMGMGGMGGMMGMGGMGMGGMGMGGMGMGGMGMGGMGMGGMGMMGMGGMGMGGMQGAMNCLGYNQMNGGLGFQGATQNQGLILLIQQLVAPGEWGPQRCRTMQPMFGFPGNAMGVPGGGLAGGPPAPPEEGGPAADIRNSNTIGFYAPALALVVRGTSRVHNKLMGGLVTSKGKVEAAQEVGIRPGLVAVKKDPRKVEVADAAGEDLDPTKVWQDALAQGVENPGLIIACADFLFEHGKFEHAAEFLKANLRQGILVRPWVYEALAIALEASKGPEDEIRRARLSAIALDPQDAQGYLKAARSLAEHKQYDRALGFCKEAAKLEPTSPHPYADALAYAEQGKDAAGMEWAAGGLLSQEWPVDSPRLHLAARAKVEALASDFEGEQHKAEADRVRGVLGTARRRDLVIHLTWEAGRSGAADLELEVKEPCGGVCSSELRQGPGGGTWTGNLIPVSKRGGVTISVDESLRRPFATYAAAQAFSGEYQVTVRRIWGEPLGGRARLEIIQNQGTPQETRRIETVRVENKATLKVSLKGGRRTQLAPIAPDATVRRAELKDEVGKERRILEKLRDIADPFYAGESPARMSGGVGLSRYGVRAEDVGARVPSAEQLKQRRPDEQTAYQGAVAPISGSTTNLTATATVSPDRRYVRLSMNPVFASGFTTGLGRPTFNFPGIPGGVLP